MIKKAYFVSDVLIYLFIITLLSLFTIKNTNISTPIHFEFINEYYSKQIDSYINKKSNNLDGYALHFNESGNISQAKTLYFNNHSVIIHLGNGYLTYE